jgi:hypothetical protein
MRRSSVRASNASCKLRIANYPFRRLAATLLLHAGLLQRSTHLGQPLEAQEVVGGPVLSPSTSLRINLSKGQGLVAGVIISGLVQVGKVQVGKFASLRVCKWRVGGLGGWVGAVQAERSRERTRATAASPRSR